MSGESLEGLAIMGEVTAGFPAQLTGYGGTTYGNTEPTTESATWLRVHSDGTATAYAGKVEYGQGIRWGLAVEVADELRLPLDRVAVVLGDTDQAPWDMGTFGSQSTARVGLQLRRAAATAREALRGLAADRLDLPVSDVECVEGRVVARGDGGHGVGYGELLAGQRLEREIDDDVELTPQAEFTVMGGESVRVDATARVTGEAVYSRDVLLPDMLFAQVLRPPSYGAKLASIDWSVAEQMPGVARIVRERVGEQAGARGGARRERRPGGAGGARGAGAVGRARRAALALGRAGSAEAHRPGAVRHARGRRPRGGVSRGGGRAGGDLLHPLHHERSHGAARGRRAVGGRCADGLGGDAAPVWAARGAGATLRALRGARARGRARDRRRVRQQEPLPGGGGGRDAGAARGAPRARRVQPRRGDDLVDLPPGGADRGEERLHHGRPHRGVGVSRLPRRGTSDDRAARVADPVRHAARLRGGVAFGEPAAQRLVPLARRRGQHTSRARSMSTRLPRRRVSTRWSCACATSRSRGSAVCWKSPQSASEGRARSRRHGEVKESPSASTSEATARPRCGSTCRAAR